MHRRRPIPSLSESAIPELSNFVRKAYIELPASIGTNIVVGSGTSTLVGSTYVKFEPKTLLQEARVAIEYTWLSWRPISGRPDGYTFKLLTGVRSAVPLKVTVKAWESKILTRIFPGPGVLVLVPRRKHRLGSSQGALYDV